MGARNGAFWRINTPIVQFFFSRSVKNKQGPHADFEYECKNICPAGVGPADRYRYRSIILIKFTLLLLQLLHFVSSFLSEYLLPSTSKSSSFSLSL